MTIAGSTVGSRLREWRRRLGFSQEAFATSTGIPLQTIKGYELGHRQPGADALAAIASTGVNLNWLLTGAGSMDINPPLQVAAQPGVQTAVSSTNDEPAALGGRFNRRIAAVAGMLANMPEQEATALLEEFAARASTQQQLAELRLAVQQLHDAQAKRA